MRRTVIFLLAALCSIRLMAAEPGLVIEIHGRTPLHHIPVDSPAYGMIGAALYKGEPVVATVAAFDVGMVDSAHILANLRWKLSTVEGDKLDVSVQRDENTPLKVASNLLKRPEAIIFNVRLGELPPGEYMLWLDYVDPNTSTHVSADPRAIAVYEGNENSRVRSRYLREQARHELRKGTYDSYQVAKARLLEAPDAENDPTYYDELADASLPWAPPEETARYYQRSLEIARNNLMKAFGAQREWPEKAHHLFEPRSRKVEAFRKLVPYYSMNFNEVRVSFVSEVRYGKFVVERRRDGARLRVIELNEERR